LAPHVCTPLPEHCAAPGAQTPVQAPLTQAWLVHAAAVPHVPLAVHVWTPFPEQVVCPGAQTPVQTPLMQV
jgi:hypothetical protein